MPSCPRCESPVSPTALTCPNCYLELKAHGHPGIPLHRAEPETYLCESCTYHHDNTCNFPQRPMAKTCTLYQDVNATTTIPQKPSDLYRIPWWRQRQYVVWIALAMLILISFLITVL